MSTFILINNAIVLIIVTIKSLFDSTNDGFSYHNMTLDETLKQDFTTEFQFQASRSGGAGGQNVNKVSTKMELRFNVITSALLSQAQKDTITDKLKNQINSEGELIIVSQEERTQLRNKTVVLKKFKDLLKKALYVPTVRKASRPTLASKEERLKSKKIDAEKKAFRKNIHGDE
jgi:ribosome-associated protein